MHACHDADVYNLTLAVLGFGAYFLFVYFLSIPGSWVFCHIVVRNGKKNLFLPFG